MNTIKNIVKKLINKYKFHVTKENPKGKQEAILKAEAICPSCGCKSVCYNLLNVDGGTKYQRFSYRCSNCGTEWLGNCFRPDFSLVDVWESRRELLIRIIVGIFAFIVLCSMMKACNSYRNRKKLEKESVVQKTQQDNKPASVPETQTVKENAQEQKNDQNESVDTNDDKKPQNLLTEQVNEKPGVPINTLRHENNNLFGFADEVITDMFGNNIPKDNQGRIKTNLGGCGSAIFELPENANYLAGFVTTHKMSMKNTSAVLQVSIEENGEWHRIYASDELTNKTEPFEVNISLENAKRMKIELGEVVRNDLNCTLLYILSDFRVYEKEEDISVDLPVQELPEEFTLNKAFCVDNYNYDVSGGSHLDTIGNEYTGNTAVFTPNIYSNAYADYHIDRNYKYFSAIIAPENASDEGRDAIIRIYTLNDGEWILIYESDPFGRATVPFGVTVNVDNADWMRIVCLLNDKSGFVGSGSVIVSDGTFYSGYERIFEPEMIKNDRAEEVKVESLKKVVYRNFDIASKNVTDTIGNSYDVRNTFITRASYFYGMGYGIYYTGGEYGTISGTIASCADNEYDVNGTVRIDVRKGDDGWKRAYESKPINSLTAPFDFEANIKDADFVRISYSIGEKRSDYYTYSDAILSNVVLSR